MKLLATLLLLLCLACESPQTRTVIVDREDGTSETITYETDRPARSKLTEGAAASSSYLAIIVNFPEESVACPQSEIEGYLYSNEKSLRGLWEEASHGQATLSPVHVVAVTIPDPDLSACWSHNWASAADDAARTLGVEPSYYDHTQYILPPSTFSICRASGSAEQPGERSWVYSCDMPDIYVHELTHNFGIGHAGKDEDGDGVIENYYADRSCPMGYSNVGHRHFNAPHKVALGWSPVWSITKPGYYQVGSLENGAAPYKVRDLWISNRAISGPNSTDLDEIYTQTLSIHKLYSANTTSLVASLAMGETYRDGDLNISKTGPYDFYIGMDVINEAPPVCVVGNPEGCGTIERLF